MLVWDETDVLACLEVEPATDRHGISYEYAVEKDGLRLELLIRQYDGDVHFDLYRHAVERPVLSMKLLQCPGIRYVKRTSDEYLEFAPAGCFGSRYDGEALISRGVRLWVNPSIRIELF